MDDEAKRLVIVGGVAGGASAAARARRLSEKAEIVMFERGEYISYANCGLPYHIGGDIKDRSRLFVQTPEAFRKRFRVDVRVRTEVVAIDRQRKTVTARALDTGEEEEVPYDNLVLSPGAAPFVPDIPGKDLDRVFTLRTVSDMDSIIETIGRNGRSGKALVVGGGYVGLELVEAFRHRGFSVVLVELMDQVMPPMDPEMADAVGRQLLLHGVELRLGTTVRGFREEGEGLVATLSTGERLDCSLAVIAVGVRPETHLAAQAGLEIGPLGGIKVDEHMQTSDPFIFAVGDAVEVKHLVTGEPALIPLAGPANRQGRIAADNIFGRKSSYRGTLGTAICKVFDLAAAVTGLNEKTLKKKEIPYRKVYVHPASHAGYYPGATPMAIKLLFAPEDGKILGAQVVGSDGVDKRIDVLSTAIQAGYTVYDLEELELAYAPPFGSAKDPVNYAGFVASNVLRGDMGLAYAEEALSPSDDKVLLDVRNPEEVEAGAFPSALNIPLNDLRERLDEIPRDKEILVACQVGLRGYLACRILQQNGFKCRNLTGGYKTYSALTGAGKRDSGHFTEVCDDAGTQEPGTCPTDGAAPAPEDIVEEVDACGLQCPGPILALKKALDGIPQGKAVRIVASDPGFAVDAPAWCNSTGNQLVEISSEDGKINVVVRKSEVRKRAGTGGMVSAAKATIVVFSNDLDRAMAAFIIANGAAAAGKEVTMFFTFWGLNILRKREGAQVNKSFVEKMFGWMMPKGPDALSLSKMNMAGMGTYMMKSVMRQKNVPSLMDLIETARRSGVRLVACSMTMNIMGLKKEELIDGIEEGGVSSYLNHAEKAGINLFI